MIRQFGADDWAAVVALVLAMGSGILVAASAYPSSSAALSAAQLTLAPRYHVWPWPAPGRSR
jgi:hypothetical protein